MINMKNIPTENMLCEYFKRLFVQYVIIGSGDDFGPSGNKPLPELLRTSVYVTALCQNRNSHEMCVWREQREWIWVCDN